MLLGLCICSLCSFCSSSSCLRKFHPEAFKDLEGAEAEAAAAAAKGDVRDLTDETVNGSKSLYSARTKASRAELLTKVNGLMFGVSSSV